MKELCSCGPGVGIETYLDLRIVTGTKEIDMIDDFEDILQDVAWCGKAVLLLTLENWII